MSSIYIIYDICLTNLFGSTNLQLRAKESDLFTIIDVLSGIEGVRRQID